MGDSGGPPIAGGGGGGPKFRIVAGRGIGERRSPVPAANVQNVQQQQMQMPPQQQQPQQQPQMMHPPQQQHQPVQSNAPQPQMIHSQQQQQQQPMHQQQMSQQQQPPPQQRSQMQQNHPHQPAPSQMHTSASAPQVQRPAQPSSSPAPVSSGESDSSMVTKCVRFFKTLITLSQQPDQQPGRETAHRVTGLVSTVIFGDMPAEEFTIRLQEALRSQAQPHLLPFLEKTLPFLRTAIRNGEVVIEGISPPPGFQIDPPQHQRQQQQPPPQQQHLGQQVQHPVTVKTEPGTFPPPSNNTTPPSFQQPQQPMMGQPQVQRGNNQNFVAPHPPQLQQQQQQPIMQQQQQQQQQLGEPMDESGPSAHQPEEEVLQMRQFQESALKACLLRPEDVMKKITRRMNEACYVEEDVLTLISDAAEYRLRELLGELAVMAEHRVDPLRLNSNYGPIDDTRRQLKFLEETDKQQEEQRENREREALIRMSKSKGSAKDTVERVKEMQRADAEAKRNRDANAAAIAALSGNKTTRTKWDQVGGASSGAMYRPRIVRVNIRDLHALISHDARCQRSQIVHKLALAGPSTEAV